MNISYTLAFMALGTVLTAGSRFLPFMFFGRRKVPETVKFVGNILPPAVMTTLVVYCLKDINFSSCSGFLPEIIAAGITALLHFFLKKSLISILGGTACYMFLIQYIFIR